MNQLIICLLAVGMAREAGETAPIGERFAILKRAAKHILDYKPKDQEFTWINVDKYGSGYIIEANWQGERGRGSIIFYTANLPD